MVNSVKGNKNVSFQALSKLALANLQLAAIILPYRNDLMYPATPFRLRQPPLNGLVARHFGEKESAPLPVLLAMLVKPRDHHDRIPSGRHVKR